jgi:hypothetical protein
MQTNHGQSCALTLERKARSARLQQRIRGLNPDGGAAAQLSILNGHHYDHDLD